MGELLAKYVESARPGQEAISRNTTAKAVKSTKNKAATRTIPPVKATTREHKITAAANPIRGVKRNRCVLEQPMNTEYPQLTIRP